MRPAPSTFFALAATSLVMGLSGCEEPPDFRVINDLPVAIASVGVPDDDGTADVRLGRVVRGTVAWLDGTASFDPDGRPGSDIEYGWSFLELPDGSALLDEDIEDAVDPAGAATFEPDVLGSYRVQLVVTDRRDAVSEPAIVIVQATPPMDLAVELGWGTTGADLDLHLLAPEGSYFGERDCFSWNPNPSWGAPELEVDDPSLDADDDGEGPQPYGEEIRLDLPADGVYQVLVHYYSDHGAALGLEPYEAAAELSVRVGDEVIHAGLEAPTELREGDVWIAGTITWPDGSFAPSNTMSDHATLGGPDYND